MTLYVDFETFFSPKFKLRLGSPWTTETYIRAPEFQETVLSIAEDNSPPQSFLGPEAIAGIIDKIDWASETVASHNAFFDMGILAFRHGAYPGRIIDTLSMARAVLGLTDPLGLGDLAARYGLPSKTMPYDEVVGLRFEDMDATLIEKMRLGCEQDVILLREILRRFLASGFPAGEIDIVDMTIRMFTMPQFRGDRELLQQVIADERAKKVAMAVSVGCSEADLRSGVKFANMLTERGVIIPMKLNKKGKETQSVAKTEIFMIELAKRDDDVGHLIQARKVCNSAINESRAKRLGALCADGRPLSVQLNCYGTETERWSSGGDKCGYQSMPRDGMIRCCLQAPPGMKLIVSDLSQIEYRALCALAGQRDKLDALASGRDLYCEFSSRLYGREITKKDKDERGVGKVGVLSCGYGSGAVKIHGMCWAKGLFVTMEQADMMYTLYREEHPFVKDFWKELDKVIVQLARGKSGNIGPVEIDNHDLVLPNGLRMKYALRWDMVEQKWMRKTRNGEEGTWGGKMAENVASSLSRVILSDAVLAIKQELGLRPALLVHDDVCYCVPEDAANENLGRVEEIMSRPAAWWPDGPPIAVEARIADRYKSLPPTKERTTNLPLAA